MEKNISSYLTALKAILWIYVILSILIAGINYGYASKPTPDVARIINWVWW